MRRTVCLLAGEQKDDGKDGGKDKRRRRERRLECATHIRVRQCEARVGRVLACCVREFGHVARAVGEASEIARGEGRERENEFAVRRAALTISDGSSMQ